MKYIRSLDLLAAAAVMASEGKVNNAAKAFAAAVKCPSLTAGLRAIEATNKKAYAQAKAGAVKANDGIPAENPGEELREEVAENGDRVVQEATAKALRARAAKLLQKADAMDAEEGEDSELDFLDGDDSLEADMDGDLDMDDEDDMGGEEFAASATFIKAFGQRAAKPVAAAAKPAAPVTASSFARAVRNVNALSGK